MKPFGKEEVSGACPVCKGQEVGLYRRGRRFHKNSDYSITTPAYGISDTLVRCRGCETVFVDPFPSEESLKSLYEGMKDEIYLGEEEMRRRAAERGLLFVEKYVRKGRLLDVGCFSGVFLDVAKKRGWDVMGIEPSSWARKVAEERFALQILGGTLKEASFPGASFDTVSLIDILEHLTDPYETLVEVRRVLKEEGVLYLMTPNIESLARRLLGDRWWGFRQEHIVYFSQKSLDALLRRVGFEILSERPFRHIFTFDAAVRRIKGLSPLIYHVIQPLIRLSGLGQRHFSVNFYDQIELVAGKKKG